jgi:tRNA pseudouridine55 synthase
MQGIILIDKPKGWTSFDVVSRIRRMVASASGVKPKSIKVGHSGTLDPLATGLLQICVGKAFTKKMPTLMKKDKEYIVTLSFGSRSTTYDSEGDLEPVSDRKPTIQEVEETLSSFIGKQMQTPPTYSALKVNGKRAYELARQGKGVSIKQRPVNIYYIDDLKYTYPTATFRVSVSSGTYIRSLVHDIGERLSVGAIVTELRRTKIGENVAEDAYAMEQLTPVLLEKVLAQTP